MKWSVWSEQYIQILDIDETVRERYPDDTLAPGKFPSVQPVEVTLSHKATGAATKDIWVQMVQELPALYKDE